MGVSNFFQKWIWSWVCGVCYFIYSFLNLLFWSWGWANGDREDHQKNRTWSCESISKFRIPIWTKQRGTYSLCLQAIFWSLNFEAAINSKKSDVTPNFIYLFIFIYYSIINYTLHVRIFQFWYLKFWYS